jgi:hypothetical protein
MEETLISKVFSSSLITSMYSMEDIVIDVKGFNLYHETRAAASIYASLVFVEFAFTLVKALDGQGRPAPCC